MTNKEKDTHNIFYDEQHFAQILGMIVNGSNGKAQEAISALSPKDKRFLRGFLEDSMDNEMYQAVFIETALKMLDAAREHH
jgi:hypothetical protein